MNVTACPSSIGVWLRTVVPTVTVTPSAGTCRCGAPFAYPVTFTPGGIHRPASCLDCYAPDIAQRRVWRRFLK